MSHSKKTHTTFLFLYRRGENGNAHTRFFANGEVRLVLDHALVLPFMFGSFVDDRVAFVQVMQGILDEMVMVIVAVFTARLAQEAKILRVNSTSSSRPVSRSIPVPD